jgi:hypothetical protein
MSLVVDLREARFWTAGQSDEGFADYFRITDHPSRIVMHNR